MFRAAVFTLVTLFGFAAAALAQPTVLEIKHDGNVLALAWSADGKRLASAGETGVIRVTEYPTGKEVARMEHGAGVTGVVFSADGKTLGVKSGAEDGPLSVWDIATQRRLKQLSFKGYTCHHLAFTPDGQTLVGSGPGEHMVWNHGKGGGFGSKAGKVADGSSAAVAPNGSMVAWATPTGGIQFFHIEPRKFNRMEVGPITGFVFSPDVAFMAAARQDKSIALWAVNGAEVRKFEGLREPARFLDFSGNGKVLAAAAPGDAVVRIWEVATGRLRRRVTTSGGVRALAMSPDGLSLALSVGGRLSVWNVATRELGDLGEAKPLSAVELKGAWEELADTDPVKSEAAFRRLASAQHHAFDFMRESVRAVAVPYVDWKKVDQYVGDLHHPTFGPRERASIELAKLGELVQPALEKYLATKPPPEGDRRAHKLLERLVDPELTPDRLRCLEVIEILEILQTKQSISLLDEVAHDALLNQIRLAARDALDRLKRSGEKSPKTPAP